MKKAILVLIFGLIYLFSISAIEPSIDTSKTRIAWSSDTLSDLIGITNVGWEYPIMDHLCLALDLQVAPVIWGYNLTVLVASPVFNQLAKGDLYGMYGFKIGLNYFISPLLDGFRIGFSTGPEFATKNWWYWYADYTTTLNLGYRWVPINGKSGLTYDLGIRYGLAMTDGILFRIWADQVPPTLTALEPAYHASAVVEFKLGFIGN